MYCKFCETEKNGAEFYASNKGKCKECVKTAVKKNRSENAEYYKEFDRKRAMLPHRVKARKEYAQTEKGKESHKRSKKKWLDKNTIKRAAHIMVGNYIRDGKLVKKPCEICGMEKVHAHHDDYARPLDVRWLCEIHHRQWHKENGEGKNA